jgi:hypothetical protein
LIYEYPCHERNYGMPGSLSGARFQENAGREVESFERLSERG